MNSTHLLYSAKTAFVAAILIFALGVVSFFAFEPSVGQAITSNNFSVTQQITSEISFLVQPANVTMVGTIAGLSGGYATGTTVVSVNTNNSTGYNMTVHFATTSVAGSPAMVASSTSATSSYISNYTPSVVGVPDYNWIDNTSGGSAEFGYTVNASTSVELAAAFKNNSTLCNTGSTVTADRCWLNPSTTPKQIINSTTANGSSTTTLKFKVAVPNAPSPALPSGYYTATGTLTATTNP